MDSSASEPAAKSSEEAIGEFPEREAMKIDGVTKFFVKRPRKVKADDEEEEILVLQGIEVPSDAKVKIDVFVNLPEADETTGCDISEYAGSFHCIPHRRTSAGETKLIKSNYRIGIGEVLRELGIEDDDSFTVTILPHANSNIPISIQGIKFEYE